MAESQESVRQQDEQDGGAAPAPPSQPAAKSAGAADVQAMKAGIDDVLDDIESALEGNAQDYVSRFVQKGGQ